MGVRGCRARGCSARMTASPAAAAAVIVSRYCCRRTIGARRTMTWVATTAAVISCCICLGRLCGCIEPLGQTHLSARLGIRLGVSTDS